MFSPIVSDLKYFGVSIGELGGVLRLRLRGLGLGFASHILSAKNNIFLIQTPHKSNLINLIEHRRVFWIYWEVAPWILTTMAHFLLFIESCLQFASMSFSRVRVGVGYFLLENNHTLPDSSYTGGFTSDNRELTGEDCREPSDGTSWKAALVFSHSLSRAAR